MRRAAAFFEYARKRQQIFLDRESGKPAPWTNDKVLRRYPFCNVFREDDRVTRWFRERVRDPMRDRPEVLLATVVFRMFNRIETGEAIFCDDDLLDESSAFFQFARTGDSRWMRRAILARIGKKGPYVTGAYIISTPPRMAKLDGVLWILEQFWKNAQWKPIARDMINPDDRNFSLEETWEWLRTFDYLGQFHSYEIVTDLRRTYLLENAPDKDTWANPGPGAHRGLRRCQGGLARGRIPRERQIELMRELLVLSRDGRLWPSTWPRWELREVEHTLCEFDKYERMKLGQGRSKRIYRGGGA